MNKKEEQLKFLTVWESSIYKLGYDISKLEEKEKRELEILVSKKIQDAVNVQSLIVESLDALRVPKTINLLDHTISITVSKQVKIPSANQHLSTYELNSYKKLIGEALDVSGFTIDDISVIQD